MNRSSIFRIRFAALAGLAAAQVWGQGGLADATLEQLLNTQVTSVSKKEEDLAHSAAAVFVVSQEDIRRSGATSLADVLRIVPGVEVAQINADSWAISIRGFNQRYSDKVLVLVDGRSVYNASFSGVYWEHLDMPLEDIERIEVIRGPGASVWGANAVNGVINIITKSAKSTKGGLVSTEGATNADASATAQYGGDAGRDGSYRAFGKYTHYGDGMLANGADGYDAWSRVHAGFRSDWDLSGADSLMVEGEAFRNSGSEALYRWQVAVPGDIPSPSPLTADGGDILARWTHTFSNGSGASLQSYYDEFQQTDLQASEHERTFDIDFQHHFTDGGRQDIVWGLGYRSQTTDLLPGYRVSMNPPRQADTLLSAFVQDQIRLASNIWLTIGAKIEHDSFTGLDLEPNARIAWAPDAKQTIWASASNATRQPSRLETNVSTTFASYPLGTALVENAVLEGNQHMQPERVNDYEIGYRRQWSPRLSLDVDSFLSCYRDLATYEPQAVRTVPGAVTQIVMPYAFGNGGLALDYGGEASVVWKVNSRWRIAPGYSMVAINFRLSPASQDTFSAALEGNTPRHSFQARSWINLTRRIEFDQTLYWNEGFPNHTIPQHARVDARLAWKASESVELSLTGQNLLRPSFLEFGDFEAVAGTQAERSFIGKITWRF